MNINFPIIELLDRLIISKIKIEKGLDSNFEFEYYNNQAKRYDLSLVNNLLDDLETVHKSIWALEAELKSGREEELSLEEIGRRAILIRNWNNKRITIKNSIAEILNCPVREIKQDHLSE